MTAPLRVGLIGAGPVTQAIHLPTIALRTDAVVSWVMDVDAELAAAVARRAGARATTLEEELVGADDVDVVVVGSPPQHHSRQVEAACRAGKAAVLCEKPLATSAAEAEHLAGVSAETGVPVLVGAMHTFDPGWLAARDAWTATGDRPHTVLSTVMLPPNPLFEDAAASLIRAPARPPGARQHPASTLRNAILGLAVHDLPLIRALIGPVETVTATAADLLEPFGYVIDLGLDDISVRLTAMSPVPWRPHWTLEAIGSQSELHLDFPPSYVHAGGTSGRIRDGGITRMLHAPAGNGYAAEWDAVVAAARGSRPTLDDAVDDLTFALAIADAASAILQETT